MKKYLLIIVLGFFFIAFINSCYYDKEEYLYLVSPNTQISGCDTIHVTYSGTIKPIFDNYCIGCHGSGTYNFNGHSPLSTYLATNSQRLLDDINYTGSKQMPPSAKLNDCYIRQIRIWIQAGYLNN
jgi:hypothetical protein